MSCPDWLWTLSRQDMVTIDVGQIILGRPWLYNKDVIIHSRFELAGKKIKLISLRSIAKQSKPNALKKSGVNLISVTKLYQELKNYALFTILTAREVVKTSDNTISPEVSLVIEEFNDVFFEDLSNKLSRCVTSNTLSI